MTSPGWTWTCPSSSGLRWPAGLAAAAVASWLLVGAAGCSDGAGEGGADPPRPAVEGASGDSAPGAAAPGTARGAVPELAGAAPGDWPTYGGDPGQRRFSRLAAVDTLSASRLEPAWTHRTGVPGVHEATPVVVDGGLYLSTPVRGGSQAALRLDPATGERIWIARIPLSEAQSYPVPANRGVAVAGGRVYLATADARLVALDASTGERLWEARTAPAGTGYGHKQAPLVHEGRVYLGVSGSPFGIRGWVRAFDAANGRRLWTWYSIPSPEEGGWWGPGRSAVPAPAGGRPIPLPRDLARERRDSARFDDAWETGGGAVWMTPTLDVERGLLFVGVGNPSPELNGWLRPGDNRWTVSVCAIRAADGTTRWCSQYLPHDLWGLDAASPPFLLTLPPRGVDGEAASPVPAVGHFSKLGMLFVWHRETGELLVRSESYVPRENFLARPTPEGVRMAPGIYGGTEWSPAAHHPGLGLAYSANVHLPGRYVTNGGGSRPSSVSFRADASSARGNVAAVDPATGRVRWRRETPRPMVGGVLATAGGVVFAGRLDGQLMALHARTGELLWRESTGAGCASGPVTYRAEGRQFVVVVCGGHFLGGGRGDFVHAFALPPERTALEAPPGVSTPGEGPRDGLAARRGLGEDGERTGRGTDEGETDAASG